MATQTIEDYRTELRECGDTRELHELCGFVIDRLEEARNNEPWLAKERMPIALTQIVDVFGETLNRGHKPVWVAWLVSALEPWHVWQYQQAPRQALLERGCTIRQEMGVQTLESNGFYMRARSDAKVDR